MEVVSLQLPTVKRYQENLDRLLQYLELYPYKGLIVAPEVCLTNFDYEHLETAAKFSAKALKVIKKSVDEQIVVLTLILQSKEGFVNQAVVIHKHKVIHKQNKVKLFPLGSENHHFQAGKKRKIKMFEVAGVKYALLVCFELRFKELWKQIEGVDVVLIPARWGAARKRHLEVLSRALAVMNQCYVIVSDSSDEECACASAIISPNTDVVQDDNSMAVEGQIDFLEIKKMRRYIVMD